MMVVTAAVLLLLRQGQEAYESESRLSRNSNQVRLAMDHMLRTIRQAGNDPEGYLRANNIPPLEFLSGGGIRVNSDLTGAVASVTGNAAESTGDPDGALDSIYERTVYRYDSNTATLNVDVGYGETVLVSGIQSFQVDFYDKYGDETTNGEDVASVKIWMVGTSETLSGGLRRIPLSSEVFIRSRSLSLGGGS